MQPKKSELDKYLHSPWRISLKEFNGGIWSGLWISVSAALLVGILGATVFRDLFEVNPCDQQDVIGCLDAVLEVILEKA